MKINRRVALKQLAVVSAVAVLAPSCTSKEPSVLFKKITATADHDALVSTLAETLLPKSATPGAGELRVPEFIATMIDDCMSKADQQAWLAGATKFDAEIEKSAGKSFAMLTAGEREQALTAWESAQHPDKEVSFFYSSTRGLAVRGYTSSDYFMTTVQHYNIIPGPFKGCVPANNPS